MRRALQTPADHLQKLTGLGVNTGGGPSHLPSLVVQGVRKLSQGTGDAVGHDLHTTSGTDPEPQVVDKIAKATPGSPKRYVHEPLRKLRLQLEH